MGKMNDLESNVIDAAKTWRLNQINGTVNANATAALARAIDGLLLETDLIDADTKALFRRQRAPICGPCGQLWPHSPDAVIDHVPEKAFRYWHPVM